MKGQQVVFTVTHSEIVINYNLFFFFFYCHSLTFCRIKTLVDIWGKYKHRLPSKLYQERMLQVADFLFGIKVKNSSCDFSGDDLFFLQMQKFKFKPQT